MFSWQRQRCKSKWRRTSAFHTSACSHICTHPLGQSKSLLFSKRNNKKGCGPRERRRIGAIHLPQYLLRGAKKEAFAAMTRPLHLCQGSSLRPRAAAPKRREVPTTCHLEPSPSDNWIQKSDLQRRFSNKREKTQRSNTKSTPTPSHSSPLRLLDDLTGYLYQPVLHCNV